jgi:outer membrane protein insertion porin family
VSYTNPYYTDDGVSRGFDVYKRSMNASTIAISQYLSDTAGGGVRFGVPLNDEENIHYGLAIEQTKLTMLATSPQRFLEYVNAFGNTTTNWIGSIGWIHDSRDSALYTTDGLVKHATFEFSVPGSTQRYYKTGYQQQWFYPWTSDVTFMMNGEAWVGNGYSGMQYPFFKNFYGGGVGSVRGYDPNSLGPRDINNLSLGGDRRVIANAELLFPMPGFPNEKSVRLSMFLDGGAVYGPGGVANVPASLGMRYSSGLAFTWISPVGPIKWSYGVPIQSQPQDKIQRLQFTLGTMF